jgi:threonine/homoserine/homoserine lactone efflux protein
MSDQFAESCNVEASMPDFAHWSVFFAATIILLLVPGPSVMYVVARGIDQGYRAAVFSSLGLGLGDLLQVVCAAVGLSALLASSVVLLSIAKYVGAAYLVFLGVRRLLETNASALPTSGGREHTPRRIPSRSLIIQGFLALNPKTALFFLALFPQFVAPNAGPAWLQILLFGCVFVALGFITNSLYGCLGGKVLGSLARRSNRFQNASRFVSGGTLIALGVAAAVTHTSRLCLCDDQTRRIDRC